MRALTFAVLSHSLALQSWLPLSSVIRSTRTLEQRSLSLVHRSASPALRPLRETTMPPGIGTIQTIQTTAHDCKRPHTTTADFDTIPKRLRYDTRRLETTSNGDFLLHSRMLRSPSPKHRNSVLMPLRIRAPSTAHRLVHYIRESHTSLTHTHVHVHVRSFK